MTDKERVALSVRIEALRLAVEKLFAAVPSGQTAKGVFLTALDQLAKDAEPGSEREAQLRIEADSWRKPR